MHEAINLKETELRWQSCGVSGLATPLPSLSNASDAHCETAHPLSNALHCMLNSGCPPGRWGQAANALIARSLSVLVLEDEAVAQLGTPQRG